MKFVLPQTSESIDNATITKWYVKENDEVKIDQDILEVATDKATFDIASPCDGKIEKIKMQEGDMVTKGQLIAEIMEKRNG